MIARKYNIQFPGAEARYMEGEKVRACDSFVINKDTVK